MRLANAHLPCLVVAAGERNVDCVRRHYWHQGFKVEGWDLKVEILRRPAPRTSTFSMMSRVCCGSGSWWRLLLSSEKAVAAEPGGTL
jgi:hypothetical protein